MCLIFFSINNHDTYKLIVAANRDEFYNRKTAPASFWGDHPDLLAGRDLEAFGTWMGITRSGKIGMLTNYRDPLNIDPFAPSRGKLVSDYLTGTVSAATYLRAIEKSEVAYNGFNLLVGTTDELYYYSNYRKGVDVLHAGFYGLSNHLLNTPWPKVLRGKEKFQPLLSQTVITPDEVFPILSDDHRAADHELPTTGLSLDRERALSSMFIKTENYGSRCSTVVLVDYDNNVSFAERVFDLQTFEFDTQIFRFKIENLLTRQSADVPSHPK